MKCSLALLVLGFVVSSCSAAYIKVGSEYVYDYFTTVSAGSEDYVSFASSFNITGTVRLQKTDASRITVKFDDLKFGMHNGEFSYFPQPKYDTKAYQQLNPLQEPFQVNLNANNLAESIVLSEAIPEWARNIQRGLATSLQLDTDKAKQTGETNFNVVEKTVTGECPTTYQIIKTEAGYKFSKIRSHVNCENRPISVRKPGTAAQYCPDQNSRDVYNSTSYGNYDVENFNGELTLKRVTVGSGIIYKLFGSKGHQQYSWAMSTFELKEVKTSGFSHIQAPSQPKTYDNLRYVFESEYTEDEDLQQPHPYWFHYKEANKDESALKAAADRLFDHLNKLADSLVSTNVYKDMNEFHSVSPLIVSPLVATLPYTHLKNFYARIKKEDNKVLTQLFLDGLVVTGSGPSSLLIKDIVESTKEPGLVARLVAPFPNYVRNPTEKLVKEFEPLLKLDLPKHDARIIEFAFASLINRACAKTLCKSSGLLDKYVKHFSDKYDNGANFEEKTVAIAALRNIGLGGAPVKLLSVVNDKDADRSVRVQAIAGIKVLSTKQVRDALLPIFYDKSNHKELRNTAALVYLTYHYEEQIAQQMVMTMWTERCIYVKNFLYTLLESLAYTTRPCLKTKGSYAKTALAIFPKWTLDRTLSANYIRDYYDREFNFGHMTQFSVQKSGHSVLPTTVYASFNGQVGGYGTSHLAFFIRIEGLGKAVAERIMSMTTGQISFDEVKSVFSKVGVVERTAEPLRVELGLLLHQRIVAYHAADAKTITTIPQLLKKLQEMKNTYDVEITRMMMMGGVLVEQPTEFGTPISVTGSAMALAAAKVKTNREKAGTTMSQTSDYRFQLHVFGTSQLANHMPAFGSQHVVAAHRAMRLRLPRHFNFGIDVKQMSFTFGVETPTKEDPIVAMVHSTAITSVRSDKNVHAEVTDILKASCPTCEANAVISKGAEHRGTRQIGMPELSRFKVFEGVKRGAKYFDCEKPHTRYQTIKKIAKYFSDQDKNAGKLTISRVMLGFEYMRDSLFFSPPTETCGVKAYYYQDPEAKSIFQKVEGNVRVKYTSDPAKKLGTKIQFKGALNFKHGGPEPQSRNIDILGMINLQGLDKREVTLRFTAKDEKTGKNGILCIEAQTQLKKPVDFMSFEGENEPTFERKITANWGLDAGGAKPECPTNEAYIKATRVARRSQEQIDESKSDQWPYKQCREQTGSAKYPGSVTPSTYECMAAAIDQTNLRESNITIEYQVDVEARNRWKKPMVMLAAFMMPYWDTERSAIATHVHHTHVEGSGNAQYVKGSVEIDVSARKENPTLDIHFHGSQGDEHFHNVDLAAIPGPLRIKPVFSRFSPFYYNAFQAGVFGYCVNTPATVMTFDNFTYHADMSECPTLLAADCDDKPRYAILSRKLAADKVGLTVHVGEHKIDITSLDKAVVDGKDVPITESVYTDDDEEKLFKFVRINPTYVAVLAEKLSLYVGYTGNYITITAGSRYRGTSCGLCGNFNGNKYDDFVGPDNTCKGMGPNEMMKAYIVRDGNCAGVGSTCPVNA